MPEGQNLYLKKMMRLPRYVFVLLFFYRIPGISAEKNGISTINVKVERAELRNIILNVSFPQRKRSQTVKKPARPDYLSSLASDFENIRKGKRKCDSEEVQKTVNFCKPCGIYFRFDRHYTEHCTVMHDNSKPYSCRNCGKNYEHRQGVLRHTTRKHGREETLTENTTAAENLKPKFFRKRPITCQLCHETLKGIRAFEAHALHQHQGAKLFECLRCDMKFNRQSLCTRHENKVHGRSSLWCKFCRSTLDRSDILEEHELTCEKKQNEKLRGNPKMNITELEEIEKTTSKTFCDICNATFGTHTRFRDHCRQRHPKVKFYGCKQCDKAYTTHIYLEMHMNSHHTDSNVSPVKKHRRMQIYRCPYCHEEIQGVVRYEKHGYEKHPNQKIFYCGQCGADFFRKTSMMRHLKEQHSETGTRCSYCTRCYSRNAELIAHEKMCKRKREQQHSLEVSSHICNVCGTFHISEALLVEHVKSHKHYDYCIECHQRFHRVKNPAGLPRHMHRRHPCRDNINALLETIKHSRNVDIKREEDK